MGQKILTAALAVALVIVSIQLAKKMTDSTSSENVNTEEAVYKNIMTRASVRSFKDKDVDEDMVDKILHAAMAAPSAKDKRPWKFIVVDDEDMLSDIAEKMPNARMAKEAPLAIIVCGDMNMENDENKDWDKDFWIQDVSAATQNMLLEAHALGLGAVWTGTWPSEKRCGIVREMLELPDNIIPFATVVIGYPEGEVKPKDKWNEDNVSYNEF